jgi:uncharacterized protein Yka (UPF0111/DUF47 family)
MLERMGQDNSVTLKAMQIDFHKNTKTLEKVEETLSKFAEVFHKFDMVESSIKRAHSRIDSIETRTNSTSNEFYSCKASKLDKTDIKAISDKLDGVVSDMTDIKVTAAGERGKSDWMARIVWAILSGFLAAGFMYVQMRG